MINRQVENFDIKQIMESGQMFQNERDSAKGVHGNTPGILHDYHRERKRKLQF